jgi:hypothetical protein
LVVTTNNNKTKQNRDGETNIHDEGFFPEDFMPYKLPETVSEKSSIIMLVQMVSLILL